MKTYKKLMFIYIFFLLIHSGFVQSSYCENLELNDTSADIGQMVVFELSLNNAPNVVSALGFDIEFNPEILAYQSYEQGTLIKNRCDFFNVTTPEQGKLRIGGVISTSDHKIQVDESGVFMLVTFKVLKNSNDLITLIDLKDDIKNWSVKNGIFGENTSQYEDINNDGKIGLAEVIHLLQIVSGF
ncbi:MAG: hypothetical protein HQK75_06005 [Candidatus Magnetomorum sp.]|nr:hypothetical protein [Candidatus Magnetomorum sp.]